MPDERLSTHFHTPQWLKSVVFGRVVWDSRPNWMRDADNCEVAIGRLLHAAREYVGLEIAFVSQFIDGARIFRYVDASAGSHIIAVGEGDPIEESYCHLVATGQLPELITDARSHPVTAQLSASQTVGVGTHLSVPITLPDGRIYGTFCCFDQEVVPSIQERDVEVLRMLANIASEYLVASEYRTEEMRRRRESIVRIIEDPCGIEMVYQPVTQLVTGQTLGVEALARFGSGEHPDEVFSEAWKVGLGMDLELFAVRAALQALDVIPAQIRLGINVSPMTLVSAGFLDLADSVPPGRLTIEVTEHAAVEDYDALRVARQRLSARGFRLAIDDVGMGFAGLNCILESAPDMIKMDAAVVRNLHQHPAKLAMVDALVSFGQRVNLFVIAEGIETEEEFEALRASGVGGGQGFYIGRPGDLRDLL